MANKNDMKDAFSEKRAELERMLEEVKLKPQQKRLILTAMEFGYAASFCARTCDMHENFYAAEEYRGPYENLRRLLSKG